MIKLTNRANKELAIKVCNKSYILQPTSSMFFKNVELSKSDIEFLRDNSLELHITGDEVLPSGLWGSVGPYETQKEGEELFGSDFSLGIVNSEGSPTLKISDESSEEYLQEDVIHQIKTPKLAIPEDDDLIDTDSEDEDPMVTDLKKPVYDPEVNNED